MTASRRRRPCTDYSGASGTPHSRPVEQIRPCSGQFLEGDGGRLLACLIDCSYPGARQRGVELVRLSRTRRECPKAGEQLLLRSGTAVTDQKNPGELHVLTMSERGGCERPAVEAVHQLFGSHRATICRRRVSVSAKQGRARAAPEGRRACIASAGRAGPYTMAPDRRAACAAEGAASSRRLQ